MATIYRYSRELHKGDALLAERMSQYIVRVLLAAVQQGVCGRTCIVRIVGSAVIT